MVARVFPGPARGRRSRTLGAPKAPTLASLAAYQVNASKWANIPYGGATWSEGGNDLAQLVDVYKPATAAPPAGYPVVLYFHPNGSTKVITSGSDIDAAKDAALAAGFVVISVEFRHPVVQLALGAPHLDTGRAIQFARALASAFNLDLANVFAIAHSRGSLCIWQALQADLKNTGASTWAGRQSSLLKGIWAFNPQTTYRSAEIAANYVIADQQDDFLAAAPDDSRLGSAITSAATAASLPALAMVNEFAYYGTPQSAATVGANVHYPDMMASLRDAYIARGRRAAVVDMDLHPTGEKFAGAVEWFTALMAGASAKEAMAITLAKLNSGALFYVKPADHANAFSDSAGTVLASVGGAVANLANAGAGSAAVQATAADQPLLVAYGAGYAVNFADSSDVLATGKGTATTGTVIAAGQSGSTTPPAALMGNAPNAGGTPGISLRAQSATSVRLTLYDAAGSTAASPTVADASQAHVLEGWWSTTSMSCAADGAAATTTAHTRNPTSATGLGLGRQTAGAAGQPWKGPGVLWFACDAVLSDRKRRTIARFGALLMGTSYPD